MLAKTLRQLVEQQHTNAKEIGELTGVSTSTVYRWLAGQSQPDFDSVRLLIRHLPKQEAQQAILATVTAGTSWAVTNNELELDVNHDGQVDVEDAVDSAIGMVRDAAEALERIRASSPTKGLDAEQTLDVVARLNGLAVHCTVTQRVLIELNERRQKRKLRIAR